jgi:hypothetical protein
MQHATATSHVPRVTLALILGAFLAQVTVTQVWREPYPAVSQPRFGVVSPAGTAVVLEPTVVVTYADGSTATFNHLDVMAASKSEPVVAFRSAFGPDSPRRTEEGTVSWLENRLAELHNGDAPQSAVIEWGQVSYDLDEERPPTTQTVDRTEITFGGQLD